jgi:hypothetical protein
MGGTIQPTTSPLPETLCLALTLLHQHFSFNRNKNILERWAGALQAAGTAKSPVYVVTPGFACTTHSLDLSPQGICDPWPPGRQWEATQMSHMVHALFWRLPELAWGPKSSAGHSSPFARRNDSSGWKPSYESLWVSPPEDVHSSSCDILKFSSRCFRCGRWRWTGAMS